MREQIPTSSHAQSASLRNQRKEKKLSFPQFWRKGRRRSLTIGAVVALTLSTGAISASAAQSTVSESAALIAALPQYSCPAGETKLTPASATRTTHGADVYHYAMGAGPGFDSYVPPAGFKPLKATQAVLAEMGIPARPSAGSELTSWQKEWGGYKGTEQPQLCERSTPFSQPVLGEQATHYGNNHWSGVIEQQGGFTQASADWYQTTTSSSYSAVTWVGIGGWNVSQLLQDGTAEPVNGYTYSWFEYLPQDKTITPRNDTYAGDSINAQVLYTSASSGTARFLVSDDGENVLNATETDINQDYDPATADFIVERPEINNAFQPLGNTGTTYFSNAHGINSSGEVAASSGASVVMTNDGGTESNNTCSNTDVLEYPLDFSGQDFDDLFCRQGSAT
jgi:hypothetical protein